MNSSDHIVNDKQTVLLIEDEPAIADTVVYALSTEGFEPVWQTTAADGLAVFRENTPVLVILDVGLPDANGFEVCKALRQIAAVPIIFLTARSEEIDRVVGLEIGADDYISKPFSPRELTARVKAVLRRVQQTIPVESVVTATQVTATQSTVFSIDKARYEIRYYGEVLELSRYEYRLLAVLLEHPGRVYSREQLLQLAWNDPEHSLDRTVDTHIKTLRAKLRAVRADCNPIKTHRSIGYSLNLET